jgi:hypothetical protein
VGFRHLRASADDPLALGLLAEAIGNMEAEKIGPHSNESPTKVEIGLSPKKRGAPNLPTRTA